MKIGYARVSTRRQGESLDQQIAILKKAGCSKIYSEALSALTPCRPELTSALKELKSGDTLVVNSIDRLGRSLKDLISIVSSLRARSVYFRSLCEQLDTANPQGMLMFNMMGSIAEFEREVINRRIYDGVQRAKEEGKYKGRAYSVDEDVRREFVNMANSGKYTMKYVAKMAKVSRFTIWKWCKSFAEQEQPLFK